MRAVVDAPFMTQVVEQLLHPLDAAEAAPDRSAPRLLPADSEENLRARFEQNHWTDFLPIILPTEERVAAMLAATSHPPDEVIGRLRPAAFREFCEFTVEKVAVNAVMAGADPEHLPVLLALAAAVAIRPGMAFTDSPFDGGRLGFSPARPSSISSFAAMTIVNGPIGDAIGMNSGIGALGPYNRANATIGRAFGLLSQNLQGGSVPGETFVGTLGSPFSYNSTCFAENESASPWQPLHVRRGFRRDESVVSVGMTLSMSRVLSVDDGWEAALGDVVRAELGLFAAAPSLGGVILVLDPEAARAIGNHGGPASAEEMIEWAHPHAIEVVVSGGGTCPTIYVFGGFLVESASIDEWR